MRNFLRLGLVLTLSLVAHALKFQFVTTHQETSGEVAAQGTTLFLSTLTGLDFTLWEAEILSSTAKETRFNVIADLPKNKQAVIRDKVYEYIQTGALNDDFAEQGFPGVKVRLLSDKKPSVAPVPSPVPNNTPKKTPDAPKPQTGNGNSNSNANNENNNDNGSNGSNGNNNNGDNGKGKEWEGDSEPSSEPIEPTAEPIAPKKPPPPQPKPSSAPANAPPVSDLAERNLQLPEGYVLSEILPILVESPVYGFPSDLRDAVKWLLSEITGTDVENWVLWDVIETTPAKFNAMFRYIGPLGTTGGVVETAKTAVKDGSLQRMLREIDTAGEFKVSIGKNIAPGNGNVNANGNNNNSNNANNNNTGASSGPAGEELPESPDGESATTINASPAPELDIELSETQEIYPLRISVVSPENGWNDAVSAEIVAFASSRSDTVPEDWVLKSSTESKTNPGTFTVEYAVRIESEEKAAVDNAIVTMIRNRELDTHMDVAGFEDVEVRLLARVFSEDDDDTKDDKKGVFRSSAGTIAASVVGVVVIIAIGIIVAVCCLPKRRSQNSNNT